MAHAVQELAINGVAVTVHEPWDLRLGLHVTAGNPPGKDLPTTRITGILVEPDWSDEDECRQIAERGLKRPAIVVDAADNTRHLFDLDLVTSPGGLLVVWGRMT